MVNGANSESGSQFGKRQIAGLGLVVGDIALATSGIIDIIRHKPGAGWGKVATGAGWLAGGAVLAKYGKLPVEEQLKRLESKVAAHLKSKGIELDPEWLQKATDEERKGVGQKINDFLYQYPTEVMNAVYGLMALPMLGTALYHKKPEEAVAMALVAVGSLFGILLPEKSPREMAALQKPRNPLEAIGRKIDERPLSLPTALYVANNAFLTASGVREQRDRAPGDYQFLLKYLAAGSYMMSNVLVGVGSKKAGGTLQEREAGQQAILDVTGRLLSRATPLQQQMLIDSTAEYLAHQGELRLKDEDPKALAEKMRGVVAQYREVNKVADGFAARLEQYTPPGPVR